SRRRQYLRSFRPAQRQLDAFRRRNQRALSSCLQVRQRRFHFRPHASRGKFAVRQIFERLLPAYMKQRPLRFQIPRQQRRAPVLVNHRFAPAQPSRSPYHRYSSAARRNHHESRIQARPDRFDLINPSRVRRSHHSPPSSSRVFHHFPAKLVPPLLRFLPLVKRPNRFVRPQKRRIVRVHNHLRDQAHHLLRHSFFVQRVVQRLLQQVPHRPFGFRAANVQMLWPFRSVLSFRSQQRLAYLRPISVRHHHAVPFLLYRGDSFTRLLRVR